MIGKKGIEFLEYISEQDPIYHEDKHKWEQALHNSYEYKIKPNLPMIAYLKEQGRTDRQIAVALGINYETFKKVKLLYPIIDDAILWGKEVIADKLMIQGYEMAMDGEKNYKYWEKMIEKMNTLFSKDQADIIANLGFDSINLNIVDMSLETDKLKEVQDYEERVKKIEDKE